MGMGKPREALSYLTHPEARSARPHPKNTPGRPSGFRSRTAATAVYGSSQNRSRQHRSADHVIRFTLIGSALLFRALPLFSLDY